MIEAMESKGADAELRVVKDGGHPWLPMTDEVGQMVDWFDARL